MQLLKWRKEIFCDLFGLIMMGSAYLPAFTTLIEPSFSTQGLAYVPSHPPYPTRVVALLHAARALQMLPTEDTSQTTAELSKEIDNDFRANALRYESTTYNCLNPEKVQAAAFRLNEFMAKFGTNSSVLRCPPVDGELLTELAKVLSQRIPPVAPLPRLKGGRLAATPLIDFRHLLHAGWIVYAKMEGAQPEDFLNLNRLCAHAILQQEGVHCWNTYESRKQ